MRRQILLASAAVLVAFTGCRHRCHKLFDRSDRLPPGAIPAPANLPPPNVPTTPSVQPAPSGFLPPAATTPLPAPAPKTGGPEVLFPDPLPSGGSSARPAQPGPNVIGAPVRPQTAEPPKASGTTGLPGYTKVRDGLFAGGKPSLDGFDQLKSNGFRSVVFLHAAGADVAAVKDMASTRGLNFVAIETTPETLAEASKQFERTAGDRLTRPAYVFADDPQRAGAVWYLYFRTTLAEGHDVARLSAKPLGLSDAGDEGKAFAVAINRVLETR
jgi:protein tyrosine phosphatase (PTP) superfamily phosphohydrolase (DUF442 family)